MAATTFFSSWELWQKMTFVLACAIVVTLGIGSVKRYIDLRNLRKHTAQGTATHTLQSVLSAAEVPLTQDVEAQRSAIPFGVRALQKGVQVEGVWISRPNSLDGRASGNSSMTSLRTLGAKLPKSRSEIVIGTNNIHSAPTTSLHSPRVSVGSSVPSLGSSTVPPSIASTPSPNDGKQTAQLLPFKRQAQYSMDHANGELSLFNRLERHRLSQVASHGELTQRLRPTINELLQDTSASAVKNSSGYVPVATDDLEDYNNEIEEKCDFTSSATFNISAASDRSPSDMTGVAAKPTATRASSLVSNLEYDSKQQRQEDKTPSFSHKVQDQTQVIRHVNSGFQVIERGVCKRAYANAPTPETGVALGELDSAATAKLAAFSILSRERRRLQKKPKGGAVNGTVTVEDNQ